MTPPSLPFARFLLYARSLLRDRPEGVRRIAREYGDIVRVPVPGKPFYLLSSPAFAKRVLETNSRNYRKSFDFRIVREFLGDGLILADDWFADHHIPAGSTVMVCPYDIQRHPDCWPSPDAFDPERFADDANGGRSELSWLPFSSGPRFCAGARLGMVELQLILVMITQRYEVSVGGAWRLGSDALISLRPRPDIPLRFTPYGAQDG